MKIFCCYCEKIVEADDSKNFTCPHCENFKEVKMMKIRSSGNLEDDLGVFYKNTDYSVFDQPEDFIRGWSLFETPGEAFFEACKAEGIKGFLVAQEMLGDLFASYFVTSELNTETGEVTFCQFEI